MEIDKPVILHLYNNINAPASCVVVVEMYFCEPYTRMSLNCSIKETMMYSNPHNPIIDMARIRSYQHCFIMIEEMTPDIRVYALIKILFSSRINKRITWAETLKYYFLTYKRYFQIHHTNIK